MVVVFDIQGVPGPALKGSLPLGEGFFHLHQIKGPLDDVGHKAVRFHVGKADHLIQHLARPLRHIAQGHIRRGQGAFAHSEAVVIIQHIPLELLQVIIHPGPVHKVLHAVGDGTLRVSAGQARGLGDEGDHILPEAVHPHVQPEAHDLFHFLTHLGVVHIQIRLFFGEQMQIKFVYIPVILPGPALKDAGPVVGRQKPAALLTAGTPEIVVVVGVILSLAALLEPHVFIGGVVHHQVHEHPHSPLMGPVQHLSEHLQVAVVRVDVHVVGDIIAKVCVGRGIERRKPYGVHVQAPDIIQPGQHAPKVADAVAVAVAEAARPDLIDGHLLIPLLFRHEISPLHTDICILPQLFSYGNARNDSSHYNGNRNFRQDALPVKRAYFVRR